MQIKSIINLAVLATGLCASSWGETTGTVTLESPCPLVREARDELQNMQDAARRCSGMAWRVCMVVDDREIAWERYYPFTPEETAEAKEILLTRAHAVKTDASIQRCGDAGCVSLALCFLDAEGNAFAYVDASRFGMDSDITPDGYLYNAAISMPDRDLRYLEHAGDAARRDADIREFFAASPEDK